MNAYEIIKQANYDIDHNIITLGEWEKRIEPTKNVKPIGYGEWIEHFDESGKWYECDQCHTDWGGSVNYCPNCGADMRKESEEEE